MIVLSNGFPEEIQEKIVRCVTTDADADADADVVQLATINNQLGLSLVLKTRL